MRAVTFCTPEFEKYEEAWSSQMEAAGFTPHVIRKPSRGDWRRNTNMKPEALLENIGLLPFLYTDIDARVSPELVFPVEPYDVGIVDNPNPGHKNRIASALLVFNDTPQAVKFIKHWARLCESHPLWLDHGLLTRTLREVRSASVFNLTSFAAGWWSQNGLSEEKPEMRA